MLIDDRIVRRAIPRALVILTWVYAGDDAADGEGVDGGMEAKRWRCLFSLAHLHMQEGMGQRRQDGRGENGW